ncbi:MAG: glycosyltransferase [Nanoarchaeota archaeon]|nr:glycosyltransferase [Nanoarchaeota archaeon]
MISVIIPALNEEKRISRAISQFDSIDSIEIIVADGGSTDKTGQISRSLGAKVVLNSRESQTIAKNRNLGAKAAKGDILIFCDADTRLEKPGPFLTKVASVFKDKRVVGGTPDVEVFPEERIWKDVIFHYFLNRLVRLSLLTPIPFGRGQCQIVRKSSFFEVGGYNEELIHAEDSELFRKLRKQGKIVSLPGFFVLESPRRYRKLGYLGLSYLAVKSVAAQLLFKKKGAESWDRVD